MFIPITNSINSNEVTIFNIAHPFQLQFMNDIDDEEAIIDEEFRLHKRNYYIKKLHYPEVAP